MPRPAHLRLLFLFPVLAVLCLLVGFTHEKPIITTAPSEVGRVIPNAPSAITPQHPAAQPTPAVLTTNSYEASEPPHRYLTEALMLLACLSLGLLRTAPGESTRTIPITRRDSRRAQRRTTQRIASRQSIRANHSHRESSCTMARRFIAPNSTGLIASSGDGMYTDGSIPYVTRGGEAGAVGRNGVPMTVTLTPRPNSVAALTFDGTTLTIHYQSGATRGYPSTSGRPGVTDPTIRDQGPLPSGVYLLNRGDITEGGFLRSLTGDWGDYRVPLNPVPGTNTFGRDGFFLHGGSRPGSAGCIDCGGADGTIFPILLRQPDPVPVIVQPPPIP